MTFQLTAWFDVPSAPTPQILRALLELCGFTIHGLDAAHGWDLVSLDGFRSWLALPVGRNPPEFNVKTDCREPRLWSHYLALFERFISDTDCGEATLSGGNADMYPKFVGAMRLDGIVIESGPSSRTLTPIDAAFWDAVGPERVFVRTRVLDVLRIDPQEWACANGAEDDPEKRSDGVVFDCGWTKSFGGPQGAPRHLRSRSRREARRDS